MITRSSLSNLAKLLFLAALAAALGTGCGDDDSSAENGDTEIVVEAGSLSKAQFIEKADEICQQGRKRFEAEIEKLLQLAPELTTPSQQENAIKAVLEGSYIPNWEKQIDEISSLGAPSRDTDEVAAILEAIVVALEKARQHPVAFVGAETYAFQPFREPLKLARAYGMKTCGRT